MVVAIKNGAIHDLQGCPAYQIAKGLDHVLFSALEFYRTGANDNRDLTLIAGGTNNWFSWVTDNWRVVPKTIRDHQDLIDRLHRRFSRIINEAERMDQRIRAEKLAQQSRESEYWRLVMEISQLQPPAFARDVALSFDPVEKLKKSNGWLMARRQELAAEHEDISRESLRLEQEYNDIQALRSRS